MQSPRRHFIFFSTKQCCFSPASSLRGASPPGVGVKSARPLVWITAERDPAAYARDVYANLRTLDAAQTTVILVEAPPMTAVWEAVNDRLRRAAVGSGRKTSK